MIKSLKIVDHGLGHSGAARYEQHFADGTVVYSDTMPDRNAFKIEQPRANRFAIGDVVGVITDYSLESGMATSPWTIYGISIELGNVFYKVESVASNDCSIFKEKELKLHVE